MIQPFAASSVRPYSIFSSWVLFPEMKATFWALVFFLTFASSFKAADLLGTLTKWWTLTGSLPLVYLAPFPALCFFSRASRSFVMPV